MFDAKKLYPDCSDLAPSNSHLMSGVYRNFEYVEKECLSLAKQISIYEDR